MLPSILKYSASKIWDLAYDIMTAKLFFFPWYKRDMNHSQHFPNQWGVGFFPIAIALISSVPVEGVLGDSHVDWELSQPTAEGKDVKYFIERQLFSQMFWINSWYQKPKYKKGFSCWKKIQLLLFPTTWSQTCSSSLVSPAATTTSKPCLPQDPGAELSPGVLTDVTEVTTGAGSFLEIPVK